jgi:hypothetical protein
MDTKNPSQGDSDINAHMEIDWYGDFFIGHRQHLVFRLCFPTAYSCVYVLALIDNELATEDWRTPLSLHKIGQGSFAGAKGLTLSGCNQELRPGVYSLEVAAVALSPASPPAHFYARQPFCVRHRENKGRLEIKVDGSVANIGQLSAMLKDKQDASLHVTDSVIKSGGSLADSHPSSLGMTGADLSPIMGAAIPCERFRLPFLRCLPADFEAIKCRTTAIVPDTAKAENSHATQTPRLLLRFGRNTLQLRSASPTLEDRDLTRVREIVSDSDIGSLGIALPMHLRDFGELRVFGRELATLDLQDSKITDAALSQIGDLQNLKTLNLSRTHITDAGLRKLGGLHSIVEFSAAATQIGKGIAETFRKMPLLEIVALDWTNIDDEELIELAGIKQIRRISVRYCRRLSKDGIAIARCQRTGLKIEG